ncbi:MAG: hypothetical protein WAM39_05360, partial [Bryobacteraceae bacterium]
MSGSGCCDWTDSGICSIATPRQCGNASRGYVLNTLRFASRMPRPYAGKASSAELRLRTGGQLGADGLNRSRGNWWQEWS